MFGKIGVNIFVLITGYYCIDKKFDVKRVIKIELQTIFYSWTLLIVSACLTDIGIKDVIKNIFPNIFGNYWFSSAFIIWGLLSPFINKLCNLLIKQHYKLLIALCIGIWFVIPCITFNPANFGWGNYLCFPVMYIMGGYLKLFPIQTQIKWGLIAALSSVMHAGSTIVANITGGRLIWYSTYLRNGNSITGLIITLTLFQCFLQMKEYNSKIINKLSACTFGIYLIQEHVIFRDILWQKIFKVSHFQDSPWFTGILLIDIAVLFLAGYVSNMVYQKTESVFLPLISGKIKKLEIIKTLEEI